MSQTTPPPPPSPSDIPDWRAIDAYLAGAASADEQAIVRRWMASSPLNAALMESMRAALTPPAVQAGSVDVDAAWKAVAGRMHTGASSGTSGSVAALSMRQRRPRLRIVAIAAGLLMAASIGVWRVYEYRATAMVQIAAGVGERITTTLEDGSTVTLNSGSQLRHPRRFSDSREVELDGEALFVVKHDARRPFRVRAHGGVATDLGTRFVVRAYPELDHLDVAVTEGLVSLKREGAPADSLLLAVGMVGRMNADGSLSIDASRSAESALAWLDGTLFFKATPLADVAAELRRKFGVAIRFADTTLATRRVTATLRDETLVQALDAIALALEITYQRTGDTVIVSRGGGR